MVFIRHNQGELICNAGIVDVLCTILAIMFINVLNAEGTDMDELKQLKISQDATEIQLWSNGVLIGAGAWTNPITETTLSEAKKRIIDAWLLST